MYQIVRYIRKLINNEPVPTNGLCCPMYHNKYLCFD